MPAESRFTVRAYQQGDDAAILDLFNRSFHAPRTQAHFDWKYRTNPHGNGRISLAFDENRLVGHYAGYPVPFWYEGAELNGHQIGDTMTERSIRHIGRGVTSALGVTATHFYENFCADRVAFNYGFNVSNIQRFSLRFLRSDRVESVTHRTRDQVTPISRLKRWLSGYTLDLVRTVDSEYDGLFRRVAPAYSFLVRRDSAYIRWRYLQFTETGYFVVAVRKSHQLVGWCAFRVSDDRLLWGDALFDPNHRAAVEVLLRHVAPAYPVKQIACWFPPRPSWFDETLTALGFAVTPEPQDLSLMCVPFMFADATEAMRRSLYYSMGDSDLF